jgi:hypothetical protein
VEATNTSATEDPSVPAVFRVHLNQFAGVGGVTVGFMITGTADPSEYSVTGNGVSFDTGTAVGAITIATHFSDAVINLTPVSDGLEEGDESVIITLSQGVGYTVGTAGNFAEIVITDVPSMPIIWNFDSGAPFVDPLPANTGVGWIDLSGWTGTITSFTGTSVLSLALEGQAGNQSYLDFSFSMSGFFDLTAEFQTRGTATGFDSGVWSYSTDGFQFNELPGVNTATRSTSFVLQTVDFSSAITVNDADDVTIRYTLDGASSESGNNRIDEFTFNGTRLFSGGGIPTVSMTAADQNASEANLNPGSFFFSANRLAEPGGLEVAFQLTGTPIFPGIPGEDFTLLGASTFVPNTGFGTIIIGEGTSGAVLTITPVDDAVSGEGAEYVVATLLPSPGVYLPGEVTGGTVTITEAVSNDDFANAHGIEGVSAVATGSNFGATREIGEPNHGGASGGASVWWRWTAPATGRVDITTRDSNFDTLLGVYSGNAVGTLSTIAGDDDGGSGLTSAVSFDISAGATVFIAVDGFGGATGAIFMELVLLVPTPVVTLLPVDLAAAEKMGDTAAVEVRLSALQAVPVTVALTLSGTAVTGVDYDLDVAPFEGDLFNVTLTPPEVSRSIVIATIPDDDPTEFEESVILTILASETYSLGNPDSAEVVIADGTIYLPGWVTRFPEFREADALPGADPDFDGRSNLLEFAFDADPLVPDHDSSPRLRVGSFPDPEDENQIKPYLTLTFTRRTDAANLSYFAEAASDPAAIGWIENPVFISSAPGSSPGTERATYRSATPFDNSGTIPVLLLRVRVTGE